MCMTHDDFDTEISCEEFYGDDPWEDMERDDDIEISEEEWDDDDIDVADVARFFGYETDELFDESGGLTAEAFQLLNAMESEGAFAS